MSKNNSGHAEWPGSVEELYSAAVGGIYDPTRYHETWKRVFDNSAEQTMQTPKDRGQMPGVDGQRPDDTWRIPESAPAPEGGWHTHGGIPTIGGASGDSKLPGGGMVPGKCLSPGGAPPSAGTSPDSGMSPGGMMPDSGMSPGGMMPDSGMNPGGMNQNSGTAPGGMTPDNYMFPGIGTAPGGGMPPGGMMPDDNMFPGGRVPNDYLFPGAMMPDGGITPGGMGQNGGMTDGNMLPYGAPPQPGGMPGQPNYPMPDFAPPPADMPPPPGMDMNGAVQTMSAGGDVPCLSDSARFPEYSYRPARSEPAGGKTSGYVPTMDAGPGGFGQNAAGQESAEYYKTVASLGASDFERAMANPHVQDYIQTMSELGRTGHAYPLDGEFAEDGEYVETIGGIGHGNIPGRGSCFTKNSAGFAGELRRYIDDEINDHRYFQALSGRAPNRSIARDLSEIARDELRNARAFSSALYMITGEQYMPRFSGRMRVPGSFPQAVRAGFLAETRDGERYMSAAKRARDNCLRDLLQTTATAEFRHARQLREILESTMPAPGRR